MRRQIPDIVLDWWHEGVPTHIIVKRLGAVGGTRFQKDSILCFVAKARRAGDDRAVHRAKGSR